MGFQRVLTKMLVLTVHTAPHRQFIVAPLPAAFRIRAYQSKFHMLSKLLSVASLQVSVTVLCFVQKVARLATAASMMASRKHTYFQVVILSALLLFSTAQQTIHRPSFLDVLHGRAVAAVSVASLQATHKEEASRIVKQEAMEDTARPSYDTEYEEEGYHTEEREICLQEVARRACTGLWLPAGGQIINELWT